MVPLMFGSVFPGSAKVYAGAQTISHPMHKLPQARLKGTMSLEEALSMRRSVREFSDSALGQEEVSQLLFACQGLTEKDESKRTAPSAGATYPLETYMISREGIFHYQPYEHALELVKHGDSREALAAACKKQHFVAEAPVAIVMTAVPLRTTGKYGPRGMAFVYLEAGHAAQNVLLQATSLGLAAVPVGMIDDDRVSDLLGIQNDQIPIYVIPVGRRQD
jgi:SagB-type dehydrogenase family enzyme